MEKLDKSAYPISSLIIPSAPPYYQSFVVPSITPSAPPMEIRQIEEQGQDILVSSIEGSCSLCCKVWSDHYDLWFFQNNLCKLNKNTTDFLDSYKIKQRDFHLVDKKLQNDNQEVEQLLASADLVLRLTGQRKQADLYGLKMLKQEFESFFSSFSTEELEQTTRQWNAYMKEAMSFIEMRQLGFLQLEEVLYEDEYISFLEKLMNRYRACCLNVNKLQRELSGLFHIFNRMETERALENAEKQRMVMKKQFQQLLCFIPITKKYMKNIIDIETRILKTNEMVNRCAVQSLVLQGDSNTASIGENRERTKTKNLGGLLKFW